MAQITITLPDKAVPLLQNTADDFNAGTAHAYTLEEWITNHLLALATANQNAADAETIKKELDAEFPRRLDAARRRNLDALADDKP